jgi:hypothetical protein
MSTLEDVQEAINAAAAGSGFRCFPVSWEDAQRGTVGGALSCWGSNISDVRLYERSGALLYTCRSENWNERLGYVSGKDVMVITGNHRTIKDLSSISLESYLKNFPTYSEYAGFGSNLFFDENTDKLFSIRFQTVFLPVSESDPKVQFCTEVYNYNTMSDGNPRNVVLLCTAQGTSVQQDGSGAQKIYHHELGDDGQVHRYFLEAVKTDHKVGGSQEESGEEVKQALSEGKAVARSIGTKSMGNRFNVQMLIQMPIKQDPEPIHRNVMIPMPVCFSAAPVPHVKKCMIPQPPPIGRSNAARVSRGNEFDVWSGVAKKFIERDPSMHGTITVTMYYTVVGGVPSASDVRAAIADLDALYKACPSDKRLVECSAVTAELKVKDLVDIANKLTEQPHKN